MRWSRLQQGAVYKKRERGNESYRINVAGACVSLAYPDGPFAENISEHPGFQMFEVNYKAFTGAKIAEEAKKQTELMKIQAAGNPKFSELQYHESIIKDRTDTELSPRAIRIAYLSQTEPTIYLWQL